MPDTLAGPVPWRLLAAPAADSADSGRRARRCRRPGPAAAAVVKAPLVGRREAGGLCCFDLASHDWCLLP